MAALRRTPSFDDEVRRRVKAGVLAGRISLEGIFSSIYVAFLRGPKRVVFLALLRES